MIVKKIEIELPINMEVSDVLISEIDKVLTQHLCKPYKEANPGRTMWVGGFGAKASYSYRDAMFLGKQEWDENIQDGQEPTFDDSIYSIEILEKEKP
jgi:hypothetical protein